MKIERKIPSVVSYKVTPENGDNIGISLPVIFTFDSDQGLLLITGDCRNYQYTWGHNDNEPFLKFMTRIEKEYLLSKISDMVFDIEASINEMVEYIEKFGNIEHDISEDEIEDVKALIRNSDRIRIGGEYEYLMGVKNNLYTNFGCKIDIDCIPVERRYKKMAETVADIFINYVKPEIKKDLEI